MTTKLLLLRRLRGKLGAANLEIRRFNNATEHRISSVLYVHALGRAQALRETIELLKEELNDA